MSLLLAIIPEEKIEAICNQIPALELNSGLAARQPRFGWGTKKELNRYLAHNRDNSYPLIWMLPNEDTHKESMSLCERLCEIVIATREPEATLMNNERYQLSFKYVLNPLASYVIEGITKSTVSRAINDIVKVGRYANYSDTNQEEAAAIDMWDAIKITITAEFNKQKLNTIVWQTTQPTLNP